MLALDIGMRAEGLFIELVDQNVKQFLSFLLLNCALIFRSVLSYLQFRVAGVDAINIFLYYITSKYPLLK